MIDPRHSLSHFLAQPTRFAGYQSDVLGARAAEWLVESGKRNAESGESKAWFCVVSLEPPHPPYDAPAAGVTPRDPNALVLPVNVPRGGETEAKARRELAGYYAHIEATDRALGRLMTAVQSENTWVVFTAVHGDMHGAHGLFRKGWPYEESIRVPLLVRGAHPEGSGFGVQSSALVSLLDLPRWTLAWAEAHGPRTLNSEPETEMQRISMPSVVRLPHQCDRRWRGVRTRTRKLVLAEGDEPWLFFDLERDPEEVHNLCGDPGRAREMAELRKRL